MARKGFFDMFMDEITGAPKPKPGAKKPEKPKYEWVREDYYKDPTMRWLGMDPGHWVKKRIK